MPLTNAGRDVIAAMLLGETTTDFTNANSSIGAGNGGGTAFAATQTDLMGAQKYRQPMDGGYPTRATNILTFRATFPTGQANFDWSEWGVFNATAQTGGSILNRKVESPSLGTKTVAQSWQFTVTLTITAA